jgi:hypothetical protein
MRASRRSQTVLLEDGVRRGDAGGEREPVAGELAPGGRAGEEVARAWADGWTAGDPERSNTFVGEAVGLIRAIEPAGAVVERMAAEAAALLGRS